MLQSVNLSQVKTSIVKHKELSLKAIEVHYIKCNTTKGVWMDPTSLKDKDMSVATGSFS